MKKKMAVLMAAMMLLSLAACGKGEKEQISVESGKLIMATEAAFAPYEYKSNGEIVGVDVEIAQAIADELGLELVIQDMEFEKAILAPHEGTADLTAAGLTVTEERKDVVSFSVEYMQTEQVVVTKAGDTSITDEATMLSKTVGVQSGSSSELYYSESMTGEMKAYVTYQEAADALKGSEIDCIVMDHLAAEMLVAQNLELEVQPFTLYEDSVAFAVEIDNDALLEKINPIIQKMVDDGTVEKLVQKHMESAK